MTGSFVATLGTKPQVVSTALDLLLARGVILRDVHLIHTADAAGAVSRSVKAIQAEFKRHPRYQQIRLVLRPIQLDGEPLADVGTEAEARLAFKEIYRTLLGIKRENLRLHVSIGGGRKVLAVYCMAAAQLLFDEEDRLWYVLAGLKAQESDHLHPKPGDQVKLVEVPVLRWSTISPMLIGFQEIEDPFQAIRRQEELRLQLLLEESRSFVLGVLSARERDVVQLLVQEGLSNAEIGHRLGLSPRTVEGYLGEIAGNAAVHWNLDGVSRTQLVALLNFFYTVSTLDTREIPPDKADGRP